MVQLLSAEQDSIFKAFCRHNGWRCTSQRRAVYACLDGNRSHPSVEMVWTAVKGHLPDISLDSVYRILDEFAEAGLVRRLQAGRTMRYDSDTAPHDHFVCSRCGSMFDFRYVDAERVAGLCRRFGHVEMVELSVRGVCAGCKDKCDGESLCG